MMLKAREIFAAGTWNGKPFTESDLDSIVNSFNALGLGGRVPLKIGHEGHDARSNEEHQFAAGWVETVWREDDRLMADLDVSDTIAPLIESRALKFVSVELLKNVRADTRVIPWVLDAVALLGTEQPAVGVLKALQGYKAERKPRSYADGARSIFARDSFKHHGDSNIMTEDEIKALKAQAEKAEKFERELADEKAARLKDKADANRAKVADLFKRAIADDVCLPKEQHSFDRTTLNLTDAQWAGEDKRIDVVRDAEQHIKDNPKPEHMKANRGGAARMGDGKDSSEENLDAGTIVRNRAVKFCRDHKLDERVFANIDHATLCVLREDPELAAAYRDAAHLTFKRAS